VYLVRTPLTFKLEQCDKIHQLGGGGGVVLLQKRNAPRLESESIMVMNAEHVSTQLHSSKLLKICDRCSSKELLSGTQQQHGRKS
jgi:hypothetical protein